MCKEFSCECCSDEIPGDTCACTDCYHGDEPDGNGQIALLIPGPLPKSCCNTSVPNEGSKSNSGNCCSGTSPGSENCCPTMKEQKKNVLADDQIESSKYLQEGINPLNNLKKPCCSSKQSDLSIQKNLAEKQEQASPCCKSRDMLPSGQTDKPCCAKKANISCTRAKGTEVQKQAAPLCHESGVVEAASSSGNGTCTVGSTRSCCSGKGSVGSADEKDASEISPDSRSQVSCCKPRDTEDSDLNSVRKPCCSDKVDDVCSSAKRCSISEQQLGPCCYSDTCRPNLNCLVTADGDSKSENNEERLEDLCCKQAQKVESCCNGKMAGEQTSPCCVNVSKESNGGPCLKATLENGNAGSMVCSCCEEEESIQPKRQVSYCQDACCEVVEQAEDVCHSANCTPLCDDINGRCCSSTSNSARKSTFTISTSTLPLEIPIKPTPQNSDHDDMSLLPQKCTTKLRVQNICCIMEANLVRECLEPMESVFSVAVNVIGRVVHVQHNPQVTTPTDLVKCLNRVHLGASIMETGSRHDSDKGEKIPSSLKLYGLYLLIQTVLFVTAIVGYVLKEEWFQWVAVAEIVFGILPVIKKAYSSIKTCTVDISVLMLIAIVGTVAIQEWVEGAAVVFVFAVAEGLQDLCMYKVQRTISGLMLKAPQVAVIAKTGECVPIEDVAIGTVIAVRPGELVALDGVVVSGRAAVDESSISGEAVPVEKSVDSVVYSGTVNQNGYIEVRTTTDSSSSTVSKVSQMVQEAQASSATTEILINRFAKYYTPIVIVISALIVVVPAILGASGVGTYLKDISEWGRRALVMLVIACPCALVMSTPIAIVCGITAAARKGALVKGGAFMETLARLETLAFDKTGTLTEGKFQVVDIVCEFGVNERENLRLAAALESKSSHPLAAAIVNEFAGCVAEMVRSQGADLLPEVTNFQLHEGRGVSGIVEDKLVEVGNYEFLDRTDSSLNKHMMDKYHQWGGESKTVVFVCVGSKLAMMIALADSIRPNTMQALDWLRHLGIQTSMITGDNSRTAAAVKDKLGLDECVSEMKPKDKLCWIQHRQATVRCSGGDQRDCCLKRRQSPPQSIVGMVGDGINDGPALAAANVGIAMGAGGTALAVEAADVALMSNNLAKIPELVSLGRFCRRVVIQNISFSVILKLAVVIAAILGKAALWMAVCADVLGLVFVILNGLRPLWWNSSRLENKGDANIELAFAKAERVHYTYETCV